jgi:hypothetical protein
MYHLAIPCFQILAALIRGTLLLSVFGVILFSAKAQAIALLDDEIGNTISDRTGLFLELTEESYFARKEFLYGEQNYTNLYVRYRNYDSGSGATWFHGVDVGGMTALNVKNYHGFFAKELHIGFHQHEMDVAPTEVTFGQRLYHWSKLDEDWNLGMWQPMQRWDYLHPEQEGLTGIFASWQGQYGSFVLFGSGVYQPEQGAFFKIQNRHLTSSSPWFSEPADYAIITGAAPDAVINYTLNVPSFENIIFRASVGGLLTIGQLDDGGWAKVGYAYKPRNRLHLPFTGGIVVTDVDVQIYPRVEYQHIASLDLGYTARGNDKNESTTLALSGLYENPVESTIDNTVNHQILDPLAMISPSFEMTKNNFIFPTFSTRLAYLKQLEGGMRAEGPLVTPSTVPESFFGYRNDFTNAFELKVGAEFLRSETKRLETSVRWVEEFDQRASLLMLQMSYEPSKVLAFRIGGEFLGSRAPETDESGLLAQYRGNDRLLGGLSYAF